MRGSQGRRRGGCTDLHTCIRIHTQAGLKKNPEALLVHALECNAGYMLWNVVLGTRFGM